MREATQLRRCLQQENPLTAPVTRNSHAEVFGQARFKTDGCAVRIASPTARIITTPESSSRAGKDVCPFSTDASDESLIKAVCRGDRRAMAVLYRRHHVRVYRFALRVIGDATLAEDIVSEVFLTVWRNADGFKARAQVSTWLLAIARNKSLSAVKCRSHQHADWETVEIEDPADDPEVLLDKSERRDAIRACLSQLSAAQREVIDLVYYHQKSVGEVAKIVGVPTSTVKTRMFYARRQMREILQAAGHDVSNPRERNATTSCARSVQR